MTLRMALRILFAIAAFGAMQPALAAEELVSNGSFTSGLDGWTYHGGTSWNPGGYAELLSDSGFSQDVTYVPGETYRLQFDYGGGDVSLLSQSTDTVSVFFGPSGCSVLICILSNSPDTLHFDQTITWPSDVGGGGYGIRFVANVFFSPFRLDNVSITHVTSADSVPEPSTWLMMVAGFGLLGCAIKRRNGRPSLA